MIIELLSCVVTLLIIFVSLLKFYRNNNVNYYDANKIPGPPGILFFGNMFHLGFSIEGKQTQKGKIIPTVNKLIK